jgi:type II secretory pathway component PulF
MDTWFPTFRRFLNTPIAVPFVRPWYTAASQRRTLLRLIAVAIEEKLPLAPLVAALAQDERGPQSYRLRRLARLLDRGTPLADAVEMVPGVLRDEDVLTIRFDAQSGTLTTAVREALDDSKRLHVTRSRRPRNALIYFCIVVALAVPVVAFMQIRIVPEMNMILHDFDINAPWALEWSVWLSNISVHYWWIGALAILLLLWSAFSMRPGRFIRHALLGRFFPPLRELHAADVLQKLGIALEAGRPVSGALSTLARYHFDPSVRHKLLFVRNEVEQGADVWQSLCAVDMLTEPNVRAIATAQRIGNRPWTLKQLAFGKRRRTVWQLERLSELLLPAFAFALGAFVLLQGLSMFLLLTQLVRGLSQ